MFLGPTIAMIGKFTGALRSVAAIITPFNRRSAVLLGSVAILGFIVSSAAVGVPKTNDPAEKLKYARLLLRDDNPIPAERLISESIEIYQSTGNRSGLATAQYLYAIFLDSDAVDRMASWYRENGFRNSTVDFDSRRQEVARYFQLAATGFTKAGKFANATEAYLDLGVVQGVDGDLIPACRAFSESLKSYYAYLRWDPNPEVRVPKGYVSFEDYVISPAAAAGCPVVQASDERGDQSQIEGDWHDRKLALADEALALAKDILGPNHHAIAEVGKLREHVLERQRPASQE